MNNSSRPKTCSFIILNYNGESLLKKNLPAVLESAKKIKAQVVVADNGSLDRSLDTLKSDFPTVKPIVFGKNLGFARGNNRAAGKVNSDIVIFLNNDVLPLEDVGVNLVKLFGDKDVFSVTCREEAVGPPQADFRRGLLRHHPQMVYPVHPIECMYSSGGSAAYDRKKFHELNGFDPIYAPFYWEDADLSLRARARGWKILFDPNSVVKHRHETSIKKMFPNWYVRAIGDRNMFIFNWKNLAGAKFWLAHLIFLPIHIVNRPLGFCLALLKLPEILSKRLIERHRISIARLLEL